MPNQLVDKAERIKHFEGLCAARGLPRTVQRSTIFELLLDRDDHPTADEIYQQVQARLPAVSRTTVYRVLDTLVQLGVVRRIQHEGASVRFDPVMQRHHHLVCTKCDRVIDLEASDLNALKIPSTRKLGFQIQDYSIYFSGTCKECRGKETSR